MAEQIPNIRFAMETSLEKKSKSVKFVVNVDVNLPKPVLNLALLLSKKKH